MQARELSATFAVQPVRHIHSTLSKPRSKVPGMQGERQAPGWPHQRGGCCWCWQAGSPAPPARHCAAWAQPPVQRGAGGGAAGRRGAASQPGVCGAGALQTQAHRGAAHAAAQRCVGLQGCGGVQRFALLGTCGSSSCASTQPPISPAVHAADSGERPQVRRIELAPKAPARLPEACKPKKQAASAAAGSRRPGGAIGSRQRQRSSAATPAGAQKPVKV